MLRMMLVTAHPDDEAGGFGGSLRLYHDRGVQTFVVCLTPGQAATNRGAAKSDDELAATRRKEFAASCEILKVSKGTVLSYPDGNLYRQDLYHVVCDLTYHVREFQPQVMMTFGPDGGITGHTDHSMASVFATLAFEWAGRSNRYPDQLKNGVRPHRAQKLYFQTTGAVLPDRQPVTPPPPTTTINIGPYLQTKIDAFKAHASQSPLFPRIEQTLRGIGPEEKFHLAASVNFAPVSAETDLFAGIHEER
jgi:LmbE family N-acetylglucosaminyl deacetylase